MKQSLSEIAIDGGTIRLRGEQGEKNQIVLCDRLLSSTFCLNGMLPNPLKAKYINNEKESYSFLWEVF
jgi:hypothetical protein